MNVKTSDLSPNRTVRDGAVPLSIDWKRIPVGSKLESFLVFHAMNPEVFSMFIRYARELANRGHKRKVSARRIIDRIRWDDVYVWEHYSPYYARLAELLYPKEFGNGFFETRPSDADLMYEVIRHG